MLITYVIFFSTVVFGRDFDRPEPRAPRHCNQGALDACRNHHAGEGTKCRAQASEFARAEERIQRIIDDKLAQLANHEASWELAARELRGLRAELRWMEKNSGARAGFAPIFAAGPSIEKFFSMGRLDMDWGEKFPDQRREKLQGQESRWRERQGEIGSARARLANEITGLNTEAASVRLQKNVWIEHTNAHARMWENGCREQVCPAE